MPAYLVLKDGTVFEGFGFGSLNTNSGEVVFNTSMTGYQEILTDPSYAGQIVVMTYPHIGNYGINPEDVESRKIYAQGLVVKELSEIYSNHRATLSLDAYLKKEGVPGISGIDTRALVRHIRNKGAMPALLSVGSKQTAKQLIKEANNLPEMKGQNLAKEVSTKGVRRREQGVRRREQGVRQKQRFNVIAYDYGIKLNILRLLEAHGCNVTVVPYDYSADRILKSKTKIDGVFLSNGPGDPAPCFQAIENVKKLIGKKPIFGICLGHQILALALGAKTYKLKFGHHGGNQPVKNLEKETVEITAQNHGFAVDPQTLPHDVKITHIHLNDQTVSGIKHETLPLFSVQYHPEASPGPHDSTYLFHQFVELMKEK
ncbi:glutamine-hydrolyzing carbamoyl-phosphate synthase small subunit [bacterium]|nr:glutamine-hydrolyzing carbamoyl-phosphate synthase small subunit [bacterium]MBU1916816.1 glutamine-hydrolyzing carbamoyl-phosphate synthase small subunit [bacterium]